MGIKDQVFAAGYDRFMRGTERAGLREQRASLLASVSGRVLEIGAGTGANLELYPGGLDALVLTEPVASMAKRLRRHAAASRPDAQIHIAPASRLPFEDRSFDAVVSTLVLCTVPEPEPALREIRRVLTGDGQLLFLEHVRSQDPRIARRQDRWHRVWRTLGNGCFCNRDTGAAIVRAGFTLADVTTGMLPNAPSIVRPLIAGSATNARAR